VGQTGAQETRAKVAPNLPDEPIARSYSKDNAAAFLDEVSLTWTRQRKCGTCHTNYNYMLARPAICDTSNESMTEIRRFFENRVAHWDDPEPGSKPRWDTEVVATAVTLAYNDEATSGKLHPLSRRALDAMWKLQRADGAWNWLKCDWPPYEHDDYYGATFAALGVGVAPDGYQETPQARQGLDKLRKYFRDNPPPSLHHRAMLLWASIRVQGLMSSSERESTIKDLLELQRPDGGWNLPSLGDWKRHDGSSNDKNGPSDGFGTGFVIYVLRQAGLKSDHASIRRGVDWLKSNQRVSGRWFTRSVSTDKAHYITHAGTGFAILALAACEADEKPSR
jgi:squalene-hopene/tetraprenyl-beta-curcumene cyclase